MFGREIYSIRILLIADNLVRLAYYNKTTPFLRNLQEFRTLFRPNSALWTHLQTNDIQYAPLPGAEAKANQIVVQDATWYLGNTPDDEYVKQEGDYFTKYIFQDTWRDHSVHGMYADGTQSTGNYTFGSWLVMNTRDTYFGGPTYSDLTVDGITYNYIGNSGIKRFGVRLADIKQCPIITAMVLQTSQTVLTEPLDQ